ncbi:TetR/AcrR family transcriptional regulator C-terminal domain-containing protein [Chitinasiproducens palmae]|uniref:Transcriptional regulator, TetR family n=1 Tax=Chitinasiproducens palmae TaxID=1770053 RepID=A0A1H2PPU3_9BURK|nr:TetR/AcrR family transcriptional regulator C-terminal domain-containing protein [Chitinasiproducens palmae]SDV48767.1 transcriptional regulator, TetR family [Chitinasiproducens palmae]
MKLDRERIVDAALALLDDVGLDALSTRALAQRLAVKQPALYWHFKSRRALLDAMNDRILADAYADRVPAAGEPWDAFLFKVARNFRRALCSRRDGARVHAGTEANLDDLAPSERQMACLTGAGFTPAQALDILVAISRYTVGCVLEEQAEAERPEDDTLDRAVAAFPLLASGLAHYRAQGHEATFEAGLALLVDGARARLAAPDDRVRPGRSGLSATRGTSGTSSGNRSRSAATADGSPADTAPTASAPSPRRRKRGPGAQ